MVEIKCLVCGKAIKLPSFIDADDYDYNGQIICSNQKCKSLLHVKLVKGKVREYRIVERKQGDFNFTELIMRLQKEQQQKEKTNTD